MPNKKIKSKGSRKSQIAEYYKTRYPLNKLRRIFKYNGIKAAKKWAHEHLQLEIYNRLLKQKGIEA